MPVNLKQDDQPLSFSQKEMESAVEIAHLAGWFGYLTPNSADAMSQSITWAVEFEKTEYEDDNWKEFIESFARGKMIDEVSGERASFGNVNPEGVRRIIARAKKGTSMANMPVPAPGSADPFHPSYDSAVCDFRGIEIQACRDAHDGGVIEDNENPDYFGVYLRRADENEAEETFAVHVADFKTHEDAQSYARALRGYLESRQPQSSDPVWLHDKYERARDVVARASRRHAN